MTERNGLLKIAPHYVKPLQTTIPIFSTFSGILVGAAALPHPQAGQAEGARRVPDQDRPDHLRLVLARRRQPCPATSSTAARSRCRPARAATRASSTRPPTSTPPCTTPSASRSTCSRDGLAAGPHARAANYVEAIGAARRRRAACATARPARSSPSTADVVVNASGPWTDLTNEALGDDRRSTWAAPRARTSCSTTRSCSRPAQGREMFFENNDGRIVLIYPLKGRVMVGTTDLEADMSEPAVCTEDEIDYFIELVVARFPRPSRSTRAQIVYTLLRRPPAAAPRRHRTRLRLPRLPHRARHDRRPGRRRPCSAWSAASGPRSAPSASTSRTRRSRLLGVQRTVRPRVCRSAAAPASRRRRRPSATGSPRYGADVGRRARRAAAAPLRHEGDARDRRDRRRGRRRRAARSQRRVLAAPRSTTSCAPSTSCTSPTSSCAARASPSPVRSRPAARARDRRNRGRRARMVAKSARRRRKMRS